MRKQFAQVYYAKKTRVGKDICDSRGEARRYEDLILCEKAGKISDLKFHPKFEFWVQGELICTWTADFQYRLPNVTLPVVEDFKGGTITPEHKIKSRLFQVLYKGVYHYLESGPRARKAGSRRKRRRA